MKEEVDRERTEESEDDNIEEGRKIDNEAAKPEDTRRRQQKGYNGQEISNRNPQQVHEEHHK